MTTTLTKLIEELQSVRDTCLGDDIISSFEIKIHDDRHGYVTINVTPDEITQN